MYVYSFIISSPSVFFSQCSGRNLLMLDTPPNIKQSVITTTSSHTPSSKNLLNFNDSPDLAPSRHYVSILTFETTCKYITCTCKFKQGKMHPYIHLHVYNILRRKFANTYIHVHVCTCTCITS